MTQATISVLLKRDKGPLKRDSHRPISLLCSDSKILTKALATRLEPTMHSIIHRDQTGFMTGRQLAGNLRRLFNIIYTPNYTDTEEVKISLDAQKAFDRVEYDYLFAALKKFGFGQKFCSWVNLLHSNPQAFVHKTIFQFPGARDRGIPCHPYCSISLLNLWLCP